ncbi:MAG: flagellar basal body P-ring formation chaperone FlgA, partial [candidate division Zixibacteria bacterium]
AIVGQRSKRPLRQGSIVTTDLVEPVPAIESGSIVSIVYSTGLCTVTAEGKAMSDGCAGEIIKVRNKSSGKVISARVIDERSVAINP